MSKTEGTMKIEFLKATNCETVEGVLIDKKKGESMEVNARVGEYLIQVGKAKLTT